MSATVAFTRELLGWQAAQLCQLFMRLFEEASFAPSGPSPDTCDVAVSCVAVVSLGCRALKVEADAQRAVEREKQREMLKDLKERSKADKEKQKQVGVTLFEQRACIRTFQHQTEYRHLRKRVCVHSGHTCVCGGWGQVDEPHQVGGWLAWVA
jgi:hypothetical protein